MNAPVFHRSCYGRGILTPAVEDALAKAMERASREANTLPAGFHSLAAREAEDRRAARVAHLAKTMNLAQIAKTTGLSPTRVIGLADRAGVTVLGQAQAAAHMLDREAIRNLVALGFTQKEIAARLNCSPTGISRACTEMNLAPVRAKPGRKPKGSQT